MGMGPAEGDRRQRGMLPGRKESMPNTHRALAPGEREERTRRGHGEEETSASNNECICRRFVVFLPFSIALFISP